MLRRSVACLPSLILCGLAAPAAGQTDYFNTDRNRPVRVEDAYATERHAFELKLAPLRLERESGGTYHWEIDPEIAYGILPRTQVELGFPLAVVDAGDAGREAGLAGIELSALHNLNIETAGLPALGIRGDVLLPVGRLAPDRVHPAVTGIATRTFSWARFHVNAQYTFGEGPERVEPHGPDDAFTTGREVSRWLTGVAVDRAFPLRALLIIGEAYAQRPLMEGSGVVWNTGAGFRYQVNPYLAVDAGAGRRLTGDTGWYVTFGSAFAFGLRALVPVPR